MSIASPQHPPSAADYELPPSLAWKHELRARLREHRQRRGGAGLPVHSSGHAESRISSRVAERVALRYRDAPSYGELLAASANAAAAAAIAAQHAVDAAHAAHAALSHWQVELVEVVESDAMQHDLSLQCLSRSNVADDASSRGWYRQPPGNPSHPEQSAAEWQALLLPEPHGAALQTRNRMQQVRTHAPLPARSIFPTQNPVAGRTRTLGEPVDAFAEALVPAAQGLPAKLIEFPRELIATRKQRPRLAEGPLTYSGSQMDQGDQGTTLRIFEVESEAGSIEAGTHPQNSSHAAGIMGVEELEQTHIAPGEHRMQTQSKNGQAERRQLGFEGGPALATDTQSGWAAIHLGEHPGRHVSEPLNEQSSALSQPAAARLPEQGYAAEPLPALHDLAPVSDRFMAALVDGAIVCSCFLLTVLVFASCTVHPPAGKGAIAISALVFCALATFYGWLFMSYGGGSTPGMRYARIALCTFRDENPRRRDLQNRVPATALSLLPLGLGAFWALLDEDKLGWHDRMTRTYQRSYR